MDESSSSVPTSRLASLDAYRGFVMLLMMGEVLHFCRVAEALPQSGFWQALCHHQSHAPWTGCTLHDLIQPSFSFIVGVALCFSVARRREGGGPTWRMTAHALWRGLALVCLGIFLRSIGHVRTNFTFEDTLTQIGLGYPLLFLLALRPARDQRIALGAILFGYWLAFALYPLPGAGFDPASVDIPEGWPYWMSGFAGHWNKQTNLAAAFDRWFLNLFPRESPFVLNGGGYQTLSFIPTLGTMVLGLIAGGLLRGDRTPGRKVLWLAAGGLIGLAAGALLGWLGVCPVVKRIWTPSWVLFSGGWCLLFLAGFYAVIDVRGWRRWAFPLVVIGMNSIAAYCMDWLFVRFIAAALPRHLGEGVFRVLGDPLQPLLHGAAVLLVLWLILLWMYRRKIYLRI